MNARPNFLWLVGEDCGPRFAAWNDPVAHTPVVDELAREGIRFTRAFSTAPVCAPSRFAMFTGVYATSAGPAHHMAAEAILPSHISGLPTYLRQAGYYCTNNAKTHYNARLDAKAIWNESSTTAHWINRPSGAPFFSVFNFGITHESALFKYEHTVTNRLDVRIPNYLPDTPGIRGDIARSYDVVADLDSQIGARLGELSAEERDNTIIFILADHGGIHARSKRYCYEEGVHCPLVVWFPERWRHLAPEKAGGVVDTPISWVDLPPTLLSLAQVPVPAHMQGSNFLGPAPRSSGYAFSGRNRMDERYDFVRAVASKKYRYIRNYMPHLPHGQHQSYGWMARGYQEWESAWLEGGLSESQRRFWETKPFEELYDIEADPDQIHNLADSMEHDAVLTELRDALDAHMIGIRDNGFIPEGHPAEGYQASRDATAYPLQRIINIAGLAAERDSARKAEIVSLTRDPNDICRYWAVMGLLMLGQLTSSEVTLLREMVQDDSCDFVRIAGAEAIVRHLVDPEMIMFLLTMADAPNAPSKRLMALNALTYATKPNLQLRIGLSKLRSFLESGDEYMRNAVRYLIAQLDGSYRPSLQLFDYHWYETVGIKKQNSFSD